MERFDAVVVGAGPAGSTTAFRLASAGASLLLLDRARFPRDKPCGGGLTGRALRELPVPVDGVVEAVASRVRVECGRRWGFERAFAEPLVHLTRRRVLDAYLAERAADAGADFRDGVKVEAVEGTTVTLAGGRRVRGEVLIGADGANGLVARSALLAADLEHGVGLEGNAPYDERFRDTLVLEFGTVPGGYGWIFPKAGHLNVGVGGWASEGKRMRAHLARLCETHGLDAGALADVRGHRLPMRRAETAVTRGRVAVVGDAAGLVDPFTGDGMFEALLSARLCAEETLELLGGRAASLERYQARLTASLSELLASSWRLKHALDRFPRLAMTVVRSPPVWPAITAVIRGDLTHPDAAGGVARIPFAALRALARLAVV